MRTRELARSVVVCELWPPRGKLGLWVYLKIGIAPKAIVFFSRVFKGFVGPTSPQSLMCVLDQLVLPP